MPTGYTAKLMETGEDFRAFALRCAKAFGACVTLRDDDMDAPIPERFEPSDYSVKALAQAERKLKRLAKLSNAEQRKFGETAKRKAVATRKTWANKARAEDTRLDEMAKRVEVWTPPSPDHVGLRDFMLEQIKVSRNDAAYWDKLTFAEEAKEPLRFYTDALAEAARSVDYHRKEVAKEKERVDGRNRWIQQLRASLPE